MWDREHRIDNLNTNSGITTLNINTICQSLDSAVDIPENGHSKTQNVQKHNTEKNEKTEYQDPDSLSEYDSDSQFLNLLLKEPKTTHSLYRVVNDAIDDSFDCQRPNAMEQMARNLCFKYLSFIDCLQHCQCDLFGSSIIALDSYLSDIDVQITPPTTYSLNTRKAILQFLVSTKRQLLRIDPLRYRMSESIETSQGTESKESNDSKTSNQSNESTKCAVPKLNGSSISLCDFKAENTKMHELERKVHGEYNGIRSVIVTVQSVDVREGSNMIRNVVNFMVMSYSKTNELMRCTVSMDIVVNTDSTKHQDEMRSHHLMQWMKTHCIDAADHRIYRYLFAVKQWAQHFQVNSSVESTINGYGWIHIAMFVLFRDFRSKSNESNCIYPDVVLPDNVTTAKLMFLFIEVLHQWIGDPQKRVQNQRQHRGHKQSGNGSTSPRRRGMDVIKGQWVDNPLDFSLFVVDPFSESATGNLAKCVRERKGIPLLRKAIERSVMQLQFAADEARKGNVSGITKHIEFISTKRGSAMNEEKEQQNEFADFDELAKMGNLENFKWDSLCSMNLGLPKREWISKWNKSKGNNQTNNSNEMEVESQDEMDILTVVQFNCLAQDLTVGHSPATSFKANPKYLKWHYRAPRILYEIVQYEPDIVCLCEVDAIHFDTFYKPNLYQYGFDGVFLSKNDPTKHGSKWAWSPSDGVAVFWKMSKLKCVEQYDCILGPPKRTYHVALGVKLTFQSKVFCVWTTHLKAGRKDTAEDWRVAQIKTLLYYMRKHSSGIPLLLCGDLNAHFDDLLNHQKEEVPSKVWLSCCYILFL